MSLPWFAGKNVDVYLYRVNRRPLEVNAPVMFPKFSPNVMEHAYRVLDLSTSVTDGGNKRRREWKIGNLETDPSFEALTGRLGTTKEGSVVDHVFDEETKQWNDVARLQEDTTLTPFALLSDMRVLAIAAHPKISEVAAPRIFEKLLNNGEGKLPVPTTKWAVEPILDDRGFEDWIRQVDRVTKVKFVFKRPNPDGAEDIQEMMDRLLLLKAESISEEVKAADGEVGLDKDELSRDPLMRKLRAAAVRSFAQVTARGYDRGALVRYKQKKSVARTSIGSASASWDEMGPLMVAAAKKGKRKAYGDPEA